MRRANLPFLYLPTNTVRSALGASLEQAAVAALKSILARCDGIEVAHQQITYASYPLAISSRVGGRGDLILELDVGDARLAGRVILEDEYRRADRDNRERAREEEWPRGRNGRPHRRY